MGILFFIFLIFNNPVFNIEIFQPAWYQLRSIIHFTINELFSYSIRKSLQRSCLWH